MRDIFLIICSFPFSYIIIENRRNRSRKMLKSDRFNPNYQSQRNFDLSRKFKLRLPNATHKKLTSYKSWRNFNGSFDKLGKGEH